MDIQVIAAMVFAAVLSGTSVWVITSHRRLKNEEPVEQKEEIPTKHSLIDHPSSSPIAPSSLTPTSLIVQNHHGERALAVTELPVALFDRVSDKSRKPPKEGLNNPSNL